MSVVEARQLTAAYMAVVVILTILYDVVIITKFGPDASISRVCGMAFEAYPLMFAWVLLGIGLYLGHVHVPAW